MKPRKPRERWLSVGEVAARAGVSVDTARSWDRPDLLPAQRTVGGQRRWLLERVEEFLRRKMGLGPPAAQSQPSVAAAPTAGRVPPKAVARPIRHMVEDAISPWQEEVEEAEAQVKVLNARREAEAVRRAMDDEAQKIERRTEAERLQRETERRLEKLKADGRSFARNLPPEWQAEVVADLQSYVTAQQFPRALTDHEAWAYLEARVLRVRDRFLEAERQRQERQREKEEQERKREEKDRRRAQVARLVSEGEAMAKTKTVWWGHGECHAACRAVRDELEAQVEWDWTSAEVEAFVTEFLDRWGDSDDDAAADDGEDDDDGGSGDEDEEIDESDDWDG